jgi:23S rRNA (cytidine1920-2'-O)/16S rRNA (cytidine1409-2'-O)-methyltransferase
MERMIAGLSLRGKNFAFPDSSCGRAKCFHVKSSPAMGKKRIDRALVEAGLAESRSLAQRLIMAGQVRADGQLVHKASQMVDTEARLTVEHGPDFVSRGGEKLRAAIQAFRLEVSGKVCADVGASTGGFTDCLLQAGAARVYAIDVGRQQLHWRLRQDERVVSMESVNVRHLETLPESVSLVTVDVSFISLRLVLPVIAGWLTPGGEVVALVKPQFEAGRSEVKRGGVVKDPSVHRRVVEEVMDAARGIGLFPTGLIMSPLIGPKGNHEFLLHLQPIDSGEGQALLEDLFPVIPQADEDATD